MNAGIAPNQSIDSLRGLHEAHCSRVYAVAEAGWARTVIEDVAEMSIALATRYSRALHAQTSIGNLDGIFFGNRPPKTRQPAPDSNLVSELKTALSQQMQR
jgi:hypothetical protein